MNICIDHGNSRAKVALFAEDGRIVKTFVYKSFTAADVERVFALYPINDSIISSVVNLEPAMVNSLHRLSKRFVLLDHKTPLLIVNDYDTPATLGQDRLAAAVGAAELFPNENVLIIDIGSAITYDFLNKDAHYIGGNIAPGLKMRLSALHQMTKKLPLVEVGEGELIPLFGANTRDAILAGVVRGICFEVKGYMRTLNERMENYQTIMTGGQANHILRNMQTHICYDKHLVLKGLNRILEFNKAHD